MRAATHPATVVNPVAADLRSGCVTNGGDLIADSFLDTYKRYGAVVGGTDPVIAVQNGGGIRQNAGDVLPNDSTERIISQSDGIDVLPFDNFMVLVQDVTPDELKTILVGDRVVNVTLANGTKIIEDREIATGAPNVDIVTNSFTASGGDDYPTFATKSAVRLRDGDGDGGLVAYEQAFRE